MDLTQINQSIDHHISQGITPPPHVIRAFILHKGVNRQVKDEIIKKILKTAPEVLRLKAQRIAKHGGVKGLGKAGVLELMFKVGVVMNEVMEGRE